MNFLLTSLAALMNIQSAFASSIPAEQCAGLACCPSLKPLNTDAPVTELTNDILQRFSVKVVSGQSTSPIRYSLYQRTLQNGKKSVIAQLLPPVPATGVPQPADPVSLIFTMKPEYVQKSFVPLLYGVFTSIPGATVTTDSTTIQVDFTCPADYYSAIVTVADLGYMNAGSYSATTTTPPVLNVSVSSDLLSLNPYSFAVSDWTNNKVPTGFALPSNKENALVNLRDSIKAIASAPVCLSESQVNKIAITTFFNEVTGMFGQRVCPKKESICQDSAYVNYATFVCASIKTIAYFCEARDTKDIVFPSCGGSNFICEFANACRKYACVDVQVDVQVDSLFNDVLCTQPYGGSCEGKNVLTPIMVKTEIETEMLIEEISSSSSSESEMKEKKEKKSEPKKRAAVKAKTKTSVATYGWYAAGGLVAITIVVAAYVLFV